MNTSQPNETSQDIPAVGTVLEQDQVREGRKHRWRDTIFKVLSIPEVGILIPLIALCIYFGSQNSTFYKTDSIINMLRTLSFTGLIAVMMTYVFVAAGLDLSVGAVAGLAGVISGLAMKQGVSIPVSVLLGLGLGAGIGLINGATIVYLRIPSFIVTLGMMYIARGMIYVLTGGENVYPLPKAFGEFGAATVGGLPYSVIILLVTVVVADFALRKTTYGRKIYAVGGNEEVAALAGINVRRVKISTYILVALASAAAGILLTARQAAATASTGLTWEMLAISAVIIGGTSMFGGVGTVFGVLLGAVTMQVLQTGMVLVNVSPHWQNIVLGAIIIVAVGVDQLRRARLGL